MKDIDIEALTKERERIVKKVSSYEEDIIQLHDKLHKLDVLCEKEKAVLGGQSVTPPKDNSDDEERYSGKISDLKSKLERFTSDNENMKAVGREKLREKDREIFTLKFNLGKLSSEHERLKADGRDKLKEKEKDISVINSDMQKLVSENEKLRAYGRNKLKEKELEISVLKSDLEKFVSENRRLKAGGSRDKLQEKEEEIRALNSELEKLVSSVEKSKEREKEIIEAFKDIIEELAGGIMHRSRNYLATISGSVQLCLSRRNLDAENREQLELVNENVEEMLATMNEFLEMTKKIEVYSETVDINSLIQGLVKNVKKNTSNLNIDFITELEKDLPRVNGSAKLLKQAMENIIQNSIESIENEGRIEINSSYDEKNMMVCVSIKDNGKGISEQHFNKVFYTYFTTKKNHRGNGLTVTKMIISILGGSLTFESKKGKGTKINISLPA